MGSADTTSRAIRQHVKVEERGPTSIQDLETHLSALIVGECVQYGMVSDLHRTVCQEELSISCIGGFTCR